MEVVSYGNLTVSRRSPDAISRLPLPTYHLPGGGDICDCNHLLALLVQRQNTGLHHWFHLFCVRSSSTGLKITFRIPRPWVLDPQFQAVPSAIPAATGYSFPSGHTQSGTALYGSLALSTKKKWQSIVAVLIFLLIAFSRMYLGCHTPKDVLTAMLISLAAASSFTGFL